MTTNTLEERRQYINEIKASFSNPQQSDRYRDIKGHTPNPSETDAGASAGLRVFKWKLFFAVVIFTAFVYCDQNKISISGYTTEKVFEMIKEPLPTETMLQQIKTTFLKSYK